VVGKFSVDLKKNSYNNNNIWNQEVRTDRAVPNNKPDNKQGTCMSVDVAIPGDKCD
jgi:hypothetical protein